MGEGSKFEICLISCCCFLGRNYFVTNPGDATSKATVVHTTAYDGTLERACLKLEIPVMSVTDVMICYNYTLQSIMNFLLEEWKRGAGEIGKRLPKFQPEPGPAEQVPEVEQPTFSACTVVDGHLQIPQEIKNQWITDPIRATEWRKTLQDFDRKWGPHASETPQTPVPSTPATTSAPVEDQPDPSTTSWDDIYAGEPKSKQDLEAKYGPGAHSFSVNNNVTGIIVEGPKLFLVGTAHAELDDQEGILFFGAGTWLLDTKATAFAEDRVVWDFQFILRYI